MKPSLLICEDVKKVREELRKSLEGEFAVVGEVGDGASAVEAVERLQPSLVLMDVVMPKFSGVEATRAIMNLPNPPRVLMLSGLKDETVVVQALEAGACDYLFKPVDNERLKAVLRDLVEGNRDRVAEGKSER